MEVQWLMLQQKEAEDFVIATGEQHSVREFVNILLPSSWAFRSLGKDRESGKKATMPRETA